MQFTKKLYVTLAGVVVVLAGGYALVSHHYQSAFLPHTEVAGVDISGRSVAEANQVLLKKVNNQKYTLKDQQNSVLTFSGQAAGFSHNFKPLLKKMRQTQNGWTWLSRSFGEHQTTKAEDALILDTNSFNQFASQTVTKLNASRTASKNAQVDLTGTDYQITKEVYGNTISLAKFKKTVAHGINQGTTTINLQKDYDQPTIKSTDQKLQKL